MECERLAESLREIVKDLSHRFGSDFKLGQTLRAKLDKMGISKFALEMQHHFRD